MISSTTRIAGPYSGTGIQTVFTFAFKVFQTSDVLVVLTDPYGNNTTQTLTSQYTVTLNSNQDTSPGGTVTMITAPASGYTVTLSSQVQELQTTNLTNAGNFYPSAVNNALDYLTILIQQLTLQVDNALQLPISVQNVTPTLPSPVASAFIGWNNSGNGLANYSGLTGTPVSSAMTPVVASATAAAARTALGITPAAIGAQVAGSYAASGANSDITSLGALATVPTVVTTAIGAATVQIQSVGASVASNILTVTYAGELLTFRNPTLTNGAPVQVTVGAQSLTVPSGATLGTVSGQQSQLILVELYNGGTPALGIVNIAGGVNLDETTLISTTAINSSASSASTVYSPSAISSSPFRVIGEIVSTQTTAGTWATLPTLVQGCGGQALAALQSVGMGQTWQDVTASRSASTTYYNSTGRPITVSVILQGTGSGQGSITIAGVTMVASIIQAANATHQYSYVIPPGQTYNYAVTGTILKWQELR